LSGDPADPDPLPRRLVSLVPSTTETLFALGVGDRVVGVTDFCTRPDPMPGHVQRVGGTKTPDLAAIRALAPDLVLANREENRREDVAALAAWTTVEVAYPRTVPEAVADIRRLGSLVGAEARAAELATDIEGRAEAVRRAARPHRFAYLVWRRPWMAAGQDTFVDALLALGGGRNVLRPAEGRYPVVDLADLGARRPDVVLLPDEPYPFEPRHVDEVAAAMGPAYLARCRLVSGDNYCWHGVRLLAGLADYADWLRERAVAT
jgi:ABC-type Fe3+-hydroxamate transport system substrate-binding protein